MLVFTRFYDLGTRAMSHDEAQHAVYSFNLYESGDYRHQPFLHGPFLFHLNAFLFFLFGVSDATARFGPALAAVAGAAVIFLFRGYLGRLGALSTALVILVSPTLLFYGRYLRNDIYIAFFVLIWIYCVFRYLESPRPGPLYGLVGAMGLAFATKENSFIFGATLGSFLVIVGIKRILGDGRMGSKRSEADLSVLMLTLALPFTAAFAYLALGRDVANYPVAANLSRNVGLIAGFSIAGLALAAFWFGSRGLARRLGESPISVAIVLRLAGLFWLIQVSLFTTFFTNLQGIITGPLGSLGYWLTQHPVARGGQPVYYYLILGGVYEFLAIFLGLAAAFVLFRRLGKKDWLPVVTRDLPRDHSSTGGSRDLFFAFLIWWMFFSWLAYSFAGERMPWLIIHIVLPTCLLAGWCLGRLLSGIDWGSVREGKALWLLGAFPIVLLILRVLVGTAPFQGRDPTSIGATVRWLLTLIFAGLLAYACARLGRRVGGRLSLRLSLVGLIAVLFLLTVRTSLMFNFLNYDMATELAVYAHATPDVKKALHEIDLMSRRTAGGRQLAVAFDDHSAWPFTWYLRDYPNRKFYASNPNLDAMKAPVVITGPNNYERVRPFMARDYDKRVYRLIWWPVESYHDLSVSRLLDILGSPDQRSRFWQFLAYRRYPGVSLAQWPYRQEFEMYVRRDLADQMWDLGTLPRSRDRPEFSGEEAELELVSTYVGPYEGKALRRPRDIAVGPGGRRIIADSDNSRIVVLEANGDFLRAFGSPCNLGEEGSPGCSDPDGPGPLEPGDGQFSEIWGVAVDGQGRIYVSDTWNGRIQVFDANGRFTRKWGHFGMVADDPSDTLALFGPRGLAVDSEANLLIADTGNKRILRYSPEGEFLSQVGKGGIGPGQFDEPVAVAVAPESGDIVVADAWNQRIQQLESDLSFAAEFQVPGWRDQGLFFKPYVSLDMEGRIFASDPEFSRILIYNAEGELETLLGRPGDQTRLRNPNGVAWDSQAGVLLIADAHNNRVVAAQVP